MTTYHCMACSALLETEKLLVGNIVKVKPCEACLEAAEEAALDAAEAKEFEEEIVDRNEILTQKVLGNLNLVNSENESTERGDQK